MNAEREGELTRRWRTVRDASALAEIVLSHRQLVLGLAKRFRGFDVSFDDLIQEGNAALVHAANRFDPARGVRFSTYATWWVRAAVQDFVIANRSVVRCVTSGARRSLFFRLQRLRYGWRIDGRMSGEERQQAAGVLDVPLSAIEEMDAFLGGADWPAIEECDPNVVNGVVLLAEEPSPEERVIDAHERRKKRLRLQTVLSGLTERELTIIIARHLTDSPSSLRDLGSHFGISGERVRQIESVALSKLRDWIVGNRPDGTVAMPSAAETMNSQR